MIPRGCVERCPGCRHRGWSAARSGEAKRGFVVEKLARWGARVEDVRAVGDERRWGYRERTQLRARVEGGAWRFGMVRTGFSGGTSGRFDEEFIAIPECPIHSARVNGILAVAARVTPVDVPLHAVVVSGGLLTLILKQHESEALVSRLREVFSSLVGETLKGVFLNFNPSAGNRLISSRGWVHLAGESVVREPGGFSYGPSSFQQLIPGLYFDALARAHEFLAPGPRVRVLDLYSGSGHSIARWCGAGALSIGVELAGESVELSERVLGAGAILRGRVSERLPQLEEWLLSGSGEWVVFANPPRLGLEPEVLSWLARVRPSRIVYLSCSPGTLARDLGGLADAGYGVDKLIPYDFFPQTHHVETLACLADTRVSRAADPRRDDRAD